MYFKDVKCDDCGNIYEITKARIVDDFVLIDCPKCKSSNVHIVYNIVDTDICEGLCGNATTGYAKGITYHPSKYGKMKGTKIL